jgi:hypothetical protein
LAGTIADIERILRASEAALEVRIMAAATTPPRLPTV